MVLPVCVLSLPKACVPNLCVAVRAQSKLLASIRGGPVAPEEKYLNVYLFKRETNLNAFSTCRIHFFHSLIILTLNFRLMCFARVGVVDSYN